MTKKEREKLERAVDLFGKNGHAWNEAMEILLDLLRDSKKQEPSA